MSEKFQNGSFFFLKSKCYEQHIFHEKYMTFFVTSVVQILQKLQVKPNQEHLIVTDVFRASSIIYSVKATETLVFPHYSHPTAT